MLKRIFLLSVILLAAVGRPVKVSALTPEERFDSLMTEAILVRDVHDYIVKLQEAEEYYSNNVIMDFPGKGLLNFCFGEYYLAINDYRRAAEFYDRAETFWEDYPEYKYEKIMLRLVECQYLEAISDTKTAISERISLSEVIEKYYGRSNDFYIENAEALLADYIIICDIDKTNEMVALLTELDYDERVANTKSKFKAFYHIARGEFDKAIDDYQKYQSENAITIDELHHLISYIILKAMPSKFPALQRQTINGLHKTTVNNIIHFAEREHGIYPLKIIAYISDYIGMLDEYPELTRDFLGLNLLRKGLTIHAVNELKRAAAETESGRIALAQIESINDSIHELSARSDGFFKIERSQLHLELAQRKLHTFVPDINKLSACIDLDEEDAFKALPPGAVGVDFIRYAFSETDFRYGAFVYDGMGELEFIDLFEEDELRKRLASSSNYEIEFFLDKSNTQFVWGKLLPIIEKYDEVYFSPDGMLNLLAIEFLLTDDDTTACDRYKLHRVFHLADIEEPVKLGDYFAAFGVSRYGYSKQDDFGQIVADPDRGSFVNLPGVDKELKNISNVITDACPNMRVSCNNSAEERQVVDISGSDVTAMHFACHGFYVTLYDMKDASELPDNPNFNISRRMNYLWAESYMPQRDFSGLLLRNGNYSWSSMSSLGRYDDLLTVDEISGLNFPNLNLTVLSACESGMGEIDFDGVMGLQRAFRKAGTRNLICSLIRVNDNITSDFMTTFYTLAARGATVRDAFVAARRKLQEDYPRRPDYWAAWILIE